MMPQTLPITKYRKDYQAPFFSLASVKLHFKLDSQSTHLLSTMTVKPNGSWSIEKHGTLILNGEDLELLSLSINGKEHPYYELSESELRISQLPNDGAQDFELSIETLCHPQLNTKLSGLYLSNNTLLTHCEAEGFRRITFFLDRPDVMATYQVTIDADKELYPVLLSNGNLVRQEDLANGLHRVIWEDPFPKPSYLFALVAGKLGCIEKTIKSKSGKSKLLQIYCNPADLHKTEHAMQSLMHAIAWDEHRFGLELDLDRYMIVAADDFNFGAMENKGLNIFNSRLILANPDITTDATFHIIEGIVAHEYFHNWTGNRVTCRDWFQLSLKEGLTVFRDQEFSLDRIGNPAGRALRRIKHANLIRTQQFSEDSGPMAHPIRPESYQAIDNFYTSTVYNKGAEVVRMIQTILTPNGFRKGLDLYFQRHDGQAVTCDDFIDAMADANSADLEQFRLWYSQAGTPHVHVKESFDPNAKTYRLELTQSCAPSPGQPHKKNFHIPLLIKLLSKESHPDLNSEFLHHLKGEKEVIQIEGLTTMPTLSINRQFTAPIIVDYEQSEEALINQLENDDDAFNRWDASQKICTALILSGRSPSDRLMNIFKDLLTNSVLDCEYRSLILTVPNEATLIQGLDTVDPIKLSLDRRAFIHCIASHCEEQLLSLFSSLQTSGPYSLEPLAMGRRALKNFCLGMLIDFNSEKYDSLGSEQYTNANNYTDRLFALWSLTLFSAPSAKVCLRDFYERHQEEPAVLDGWFGMQAMRIPKNNGETLQTIQELAKDPAFSWTNPNRVTSLLATFFYSNPLAFHNLDGSGYEFWKEVIVKLDALNPILASMMARANLNWRKLSNNHQILIEKNMRDLLETGSLSTHVREIISKALA
jgi:aminopeptidase N